MKKLGNFIRDHIVELGAFRPFTPPSSRKSVTASLTMAGMCVAAVALSVIGATGLGAIMWASRDFGMAQTLVYLTTGVVGAASTLGARSLIKALAHSVREPDLPRRTRPITRQIGRKWAPIAAGSAMALATAFHLAARIPEVAKQVPASQISQTVKPALS